MRSSVAGLLAACSVALAFGCGKSTSGEGAGAGGAGAQEMGGSVGRGGSGATAGVAATGGASAASGRGEGGMGTATGGRDGALGCDPAGSYGPGIESCDESYVHRTSAETCVLSPHDESVGGEASSSQCANDGDCTLRPNGYCLDHPGQGGRLDPIYCVYGCATDAECGEGRICVCSSNAGVSNATGEHISLGTCSPADCTTDADCSGGALCIAPTSGVCGVSTPYGFHCQAPEDECSGPGDCVVGSEHVTQYECNKGVCSEGICG